jgi:hypothetical protein
MIVKHEPLDIGKIGKCWQAQLGKMAVEFKMAAF